jgi:3,4-dihydroxy-2-butanone 4-phosphate synthase
VVSRADQQERLLQQTTVGCLCVARDRRQAERSGLPVVADLRKSNRSAPYDLAMLCRDVPPAIRQGHSGV